MLTLKFLEESNWRTLIKVGEELDKQTDEGVKATAEAIVEDIQQSWSAVRQQKGSGTPPAKDTGLLNDSILVESQGRDEAGHFASDKFAKTWYINIDTSVDEPNGYNYAPALEDPTYYDLPFLDPALKRAEGYYEVNLARFIRL